MNHVTTTYGEAKVQLHAFLISVLMELIASLLPKLYLNISKFKEVYWVPDSVSVL